MGSIALTFGASLLTLRDVLQRPFGTQQRAIFRLIQAKTGCGGPARRLLPAGKLLVTHCEFKVTMTLQAVSRALLPAFRGRIRKRKCSLTWFSNECAHDNRR